MEILLILIFASFCVAITTLCISLKKKNNALSELNTWLNEQVTTLDDFKHRKELLEEHTDNYINSIGENGVRALYDTQRMLRRTEEMLLALSNTLARGDISGVSAFKRYCTDNDQAALGLCPELSQYLDMQNWPGQIEKNIQTIGGDIAIASEKFQSLGVERRSRRQTSMSLKAARIRLIKDNDLSKDS